MINLKAIEKECDIQYRFVAEIESHELLTLIQELRKCAEALEFYADISVNVPSAALAIDKFELAKKTIKELKKRLQL